MEDLNSDTSFIPSLPLSLPSSASTSMNLQSSSTDSNKLIITTPLNADKTNENDTDTDYDSDNNISVVDKNNSKSAMISSKTKRRAYLVSEQREIISIYDSFVNKTDAIKHIKSMNGYHEIYERKIKRWKSSNKIMGKPISQEFENEILKECIQENSNFLNNIVKNKKFESQRIKRNAMKIFDREYFSHKFNQLIQKWHYDNRTYNLQFTSKWIKGFLKRLKDKLESNSSLPSSPSYLNTSSSALSDSQHTSSSLSIEHKYILKQSSTNAIDINTTVPGNIDTKVEPVVDFIHNQRHNNHQEKQQQQHFYHQQHQFGHYQSDRHPLDHHEHQHQQHDHLVYQQPVNQGNQHKQHVYHHKDHLVYQQPVNQGNQHKQHDYHHKDHLVYQQPVNQGNQHKQHDYHHKDHLVYHQPEHQGNQHKQHDYHHKDHLVYQQPEHQGNQHKLYDHHHNDHRIYHQQSYRVHQQELNDLFKRFEDFDDSFVDILNEL
jgi:hypothetical protein